MFWSSFSDSRNSCITDNHNWSTVDIVLTYRSQYVIEEIFKQMKNRKIGTWWPMYHWTDQMIKIHGLYCSSALLIRSLIMKKMSKLGISVSINTLHEKLNDIREVLNIFSKGKKQQNIQSVISKMDEVQKKLFDLFKMDKYLAS